MQKKQDFFTIAGGRVKMTANGYRTTVDAMLLADAVSAKKGMSVLDIGIGAGGIAMCLLENNPWLKITGVDISEKMLAYATKNAKLNEREIELIQADIMNWKTNRLFDIVVTNPPYFSGTPREDMAHHNADVYEWVRTAARRIRARGYFYAITAPSAMDKVIAALYDSKCGGITVRPFATPNGIERVIISARLGVKSPANIFFPIDLN